MGTGAHGATTVFVQKHVTQAARQEPGFVIVHLPLKEDVTAKALIEMRQYVIQKAVQVQVVILIL